MDMNYPLIHSYGEERYRFGIQFVDLCNKSIARNNLSMRQYYCFRKQQRLNEGHTLLQAGRLLQQYIMYGYMSIEEQKFWYTRNNQQKL